MRSVEQRSHLRLTSYLEIVITILIVINLIGLAIQQPNNSEPIDSTSETVWLAMDYVITVIFVLEALLRIMALVSFEVVKFSIAYLRRCSFVSLSSL